MGIMISYGILIFKVDISPVRCDTLKTKGVIYSLDIGIFVVLFLRIFTKLHLKRLQKCYLGTGIIITMQDMQLL